MSLPKVSYSDHHCSGCKRKTRHRLLTYPQQADPVDMRNSTQRRVETCTACGRRDEGLIYPNLLIDIFSIPARVT